MSTSPSVNGAGATGLDPGQVEAGAVRMRRAIATLPQQLVDGVAWAGDVGCTWRGQVRRLIHCGMGGSAFPADLLRLLTGTGMPLAISRGYDVDVAGLGPTDLLVAASFSGNTEETLAAYEEARAVGARVVALTAGGQLGARAQADGVPWVRLVPPFSDFQPRAASGMFVGALAKIAENSGLADHLGDKCAEISTELKGLKQSKPLQSLMIDLLERTPVFYGWGPFGPGLARIAKIKVNENAKRPAFWGTLPEINHNELVGFSQRGDRFVAVCLEDQDDPPRVRRRVEVMVDVLGAAGVAVHRWQTPTARHRLTRALGLLQAIDEVTVVMAERAGVDANAVAMVEAFKAAL